MVLICSKNALQQAQNQVIAPINGHFEYATETTSRTNKCPKECLNHPTRKKYSPNNYNTDSCITHWYTVLSPSTRSGNKCSITKTENLSTKKRNL